MKLKCLLAAFTLSAIILTGCAALPPQNGNSNGSDVTIEDTQTPEADTPEAEMPAAPEVALPEAPSNPQPEQPSAPSTPSTPQPEETSVKYIKVNADSVNLRSGAGTSYSVKGSAEKNTLYAYLGAVNNWYKLRYKNSTVYISKQYCTIVEMESSKNEEVEEVIEDGTKYLGVAYVYGAVRYHDGKGNKLKGFTNTKFDCSSLMQYIFYTGAGELLNVNTRTQVYQGTTVKKSQIQRGDLLFFTNADRYYNKGVERIGHVAIYLGDNYILHTASDYAKIEQISSTRWSYYIQAQRIL